MLDGNERRSIEIRQQYLKQNLHHRRVGLVVNGVINIASFKKEIARLADITAGSRRQLGYPQLVCAVDLGQETPSPVGGPELENRLLTARAGALRNAPMLLMAPRLRLT
jgi:hypothetical protein